MSFWTNITDIFNKPSNTPSTPPDLSTIAGDLAAITAALVFMKPLGAELIAFEKAWKTHNVKEELQTGLPLIEMVMKIIGIAFPQILAAEKGVEILGFIAPILVELLLKTGANLVPDGKGGFITKEWADNPRHQLNPDGTFKF